MASGCNQFVWPLDVVALDVVAGCGHWVGH